MKKTTFILVLLCLFNQGYAQLKWQTFEQIDSLQNSQKRKIIVFIHTDWCKFCHAMKSTTFKNNEVIQQLNDIFYVVDCNAEEKRTITFNKQQFHFKPTGNNSGIHELAIQLGTMDNKVTYPVLCVLNEQYEIIFQHSGFLSAKDFKLLLDKIDN
ncbi:MAG: thioredoxin fold domain-containing protein [Bacteroidota bacterium]